MTQNITVNTQVLNDTAIKVRTYNETMKEKLEECKKNMNDLESTWKSDGADEIRRKMNALQSKFEEYEDIVESYAKFLENSAEKYETTESTIEKNASQTNASLFA